MTHPKVPPDVLRLSSMGLELAVTIVLLGGADTCWTNDGTLHRSALRWEPCWELSRGCTG